MTSLSGDILRVASPQIAVAQELVPQNVLLMASWGVVEMEVVGIFIFFSLGLMIFKHEKLQSLFVPGSWTSKRTGKASKEQELEAEADVEADVQETVETGSAFGGRPQFPIQEIVQLERQRLSLLDYNKWLKGLATLGSWAEVDQVLEEMRKGDMAPNATSYNSILDAAVDQSSLSTAWRYLEKMEQAQVPVDAFTISIMMKGLRGPDSSSAPACRPEDVTRILNLLESKNGDLLPDEMLASTLLETCTWLSDPAMLHRSLRLLREQGVEPSLEARCAGLIRSLAQARRMPEAWAVLREIDEKKENVPPPFELFQRMIEACLLNEEPEQAAELFAELCDRASGAGGGGAGLPFSATKKLGVLFSSLVRSFAQRRELQKALNLYRRAGEALARRLPSIGLVSYNTLIDASARQGDMLQATGIFRDMCELGVDPDLVTYSTLIKGYCVTGDLEQAIQLFAMMRQRGICPDAILFNSILDGCARKQMRILSEQVLRDMDAAGVAPSNHTISILIKLYGRCRDLEKAMELLEAFPAKYGFDVNVAVYNWLMATCISNGQLTKALGVFELMRKAQCAADAKTYQTLIHGCLKQGSLEEAVRLIEDSLIPCGRQDGPRIRLEMETLESALSMIGRRQRAQELGKPLLVRLEKAGVEVPERVKSAVLRATAEGASRSSRFHTRRTENQAWRDRSSSPRTPEIEPEPFSN